MRRSLLTIAAACMWFAGTNVMAMGAPVEVAAAAEGDDCSNPIAVNQGMYTPIKANHPTWFKINLVCIVCDSSRLQVPRLRSLL